jgi:hypothetical protein
LTQSVGSGGQAPRQNIGARLPAEQAKLEAGLETPQLALTDTVATGWLEGWAFLI